MAPTRGRKAAAPPASSPLSSAPSSPPSLPDSPVKPKRAPTKAKAATKSRAKLPARQPSPVQEEVSVPSLDELLGSMGRDFNQRLKRDKDRRKTMEIIEREPDSVLSRPRPPPKRKVTAKRKRGEGEDEDQAPDDVAQPTPSPRRKRGASSVGASKTCTSPLSGTQASPSTSLSLTPPPPSSPPMASRLAGPSTTRYSSSGESDDEANDIGTALQRMGPQPTATANGANNKGSEELSEPPSPSWKPTKLPPTVSIGDTCLVKDTRLWFPAKLLLFEPAADKNGKDVYKAVTQDKDVYWPSRDPRYPSRHSLLWLHEDAVAKATIGTYAVTITKSTTADPTPPEDEGTEYEQFREKSHTAQVESLHGHLANLISERYAPAQWRIDLFFSTPAQRQSLAGEVDYGDFTQRDTENEISPALKAWVQRKVDDATAGSSSALGDEGTNGEDAKVRPRGSPRFEALTPAEQLRYTEDILLPETLLRICLCSLDLDRPSSWTRPPAEVSQGVSSEPPSDSADDQAAKGAGTTADAAEEARLYNLARKKLQELGEEDLPRQWERRRLEVQMAQKAARARLGLSEQRETKVNARAERMLRRDAEQEIALQLAYDRMNEKKERGKKGKGKKGKAAALSHKREYELSRE